MKYYYAIFKHNMDSVEVVFPDLEGCLTFGENRDEAIDNGRQLAALGLSPGRLEV